MSGLRRFPQSRFPIDLPYASRVAKEVVGHHAVHDVGEAASGFTEVVAGRCTRLACRFVPSESRCRV